MATHKVWYKKSGFERGLVTTRLYRATVDDVKLEELKLSARVGEIFKLNIDGVPYKGEQHDN